jgi:hypothetical protein
LLAVACGGGGKSDAKGGTHQRAAAVDPTSTTVAQTGAATSSTSTVAASHAKAAAVPPPPDQRVNISTGLPVKASLASSCVKPGGKQTINVDIGQEGGVAYNSYYSDGKTGGMDGYYGGNNGAQVDKSGKYTDTWVVAPNAPAGLVLVDVVAIARTEKFERGQAHLTFTVAKPNGTCA